MDYIPKNRTDTSKLPPLRGSTPRFGQAPPEPQNEMRIAPALHDLKPLRIEKDIHKRFNKSSRSIISKSMRRDSINPIKKSNSFF